MDDLTILKKLDTVKAPPGFEQGVLAKLSLRGREERRRRVVLRLSLAGSFAALLVMFVLLNTLVFHQRPPLVGSAAKDSAAAETISRAAAGQPIAVMETFDYANEIRSRSWEPKTVYLLEQVSDTTIKGVIY
jgi:hypothetical protein